MPAPASVAEYVDLVRKSGIVEEKRLDAALEKLRASQELQPSLEPHKLAGLLVRDGLLTLFQASQLNQGKWRRFTIGKYKVLEQLGSGGMGSVYLCEHMLMRRRVAVKVLPTAKAEDPAALERFYREARAVAALDHPNIVRAYDIDQSDKLHFLVMEYVDGTSFQELVKRGGPLDPIRAAHYIRQAALGLQHAHEQAGLVHRDIKPGNILVDRNGIVKILDMGLARFFHDQEDVLTKKYDENVLGTADYLAPEQALDSHNVDIRADIYSLGATFYFCLTGKTPFAEGTVAQKLIWHQTRQPKPLKSIRSDVDDGIIAVLDKMMAKEPGKRYQSPMEVVEALTPWAKHSIAPPTEAEMPKLSPAAMAGSSTGSAVPAPSGDSGARSGSSGMSTPAPKPSWQVSTSPAPVANSSPSTKRSASPPPRPANFQPQVAETIELPPPARVPTPAPQPNSSPPPAVTPPRPNPAVAALPRPTAPSLLQASPVAPRPSPPAESLLPWERPGDDTGDIAAHSETPPTQSNRTRLAREAAAKSRKVTVIVVLAILFFGCAATLLWYIIRESNQAVEKNDDSGTKDSDKDKVEKDKNDKDDKDKDDKKQPIKPRVPVTYKVGPKSLYPSFISVMGQLQSGDRIVVEDDITDQFFLSEQRARDLQNITIEADTKKARVVWKPRPTQDPKSPLITLNDAVNFTIRGFVFDGENKLQHLINLNTACAGVKLEKLELINYVTDGIRFRNCMAPVDNPVILEGLKSKSDKPPLSFIVATFYPNHPQNSNIHVKNDCVFEGNFTIIVDDPKAENIVLPETLKAKTQFKK